MLGAVNVMVTPVGNQLQVPQVVHQVSLSLESENARSRVVALETENERLKECLVRTQQVKDTSQQAEILKLQRKITELKTDVSSFNLFSLVYFIISNSFYVGSFARFED